MFRTTLVRTLDDVKRMHPQAILPGEPEPAWLRRKAEYARELPLLLAEQSRQTADERRPSLLGRVRMAISR
jgi:hypothetical protein